MINKNTFISPNTYEELTHQAKRIMQCKRMLPKEKQNYSIPEVEAVIQIGQTYGLSPWQSMQAIMFVNGQASVWGDFLIGLVWASGKAREIREYTEGTIEAGDFVCLCEVKRAESVILRKFSMNDAKKAGLWLRGPIWKSYPQRMLQMRARSWALRDAFGDVTKGLVAVEEAVDYKPLKDNTEPNKIEEAIINTMTDVEPEKKAELTKEVDKELIKLTADRLSGHGFTDDEIYKLVYNFLIDKPGDWDQLNSRAISNFEVFFELITKDMVQTQVEVEDE